MFSFEAEYSKVLGAKPPGNFSACRESRYEALPLYKPFQIFPGPASPTVYLNPDMDILCLTHFEGRANGQIWRTFENLGISFRRIAIWGDGYFLRRSYYRFWLKGHHLRNFEELLVVEDQWEESRLITGFEEETDWEPPFLRGIAYRMDMIFQRLSEGDPALKMKAPLLRAGSFF